MSRHKGNQSKDAYGIIPRRSEYDDAILRNNKRTGNRQRLDWHYQERAQKVIMKDLGKESLLLQSKLETDKKTLSLGLFGSKFGTKTSNPIRKYSSTSPTGKVLSSSSFRPTVTQTTNGKSENRFPWDISDRDSTVERNSVLSNNTTPMPSSRSNMRFRTPSSSAAYMSSRAQTDDFLANILNEAMNDELLYTQSAELGNVKSETPRNGTSSRRSRKASRNRLLDTPTDSLVNALANADQPTPEP